MTSSRSDVIRGRAAYAGMTVPELAKRCGPPRSTMEERAKDPGAMRLWELGKVSKAVKGLSISDLEALGVMVRRGRYE